MNQHGKASEGWDGFEFASLNEAGNYRRALLREFGPNLKGRVLEIGAGVGQITEMLMTVSTIELLASVEPNPSFCSEIRRRFPAHSIINGTSADIPSKGDWNSIVSINVLEHIQDDEDELARYYALLARRSGTLNLFVPARPELYAPIDKDFGHFRRYTKPDLKHKLEQAGFKVERLRYFNIVGYIAWWAAFCFLKKRQFSARSVRIFDRLIFPSVYRLESAIAPPPFGQSLLAVAKA